MMTNKEIYAKEINTMDDYKISVKDFMDILEEAQQTRLFFSHIEEIKKGFLDEYDVAVDWSIPLIMVKWFSIEPDDEKVNRLCKRILAKRA